MTSSESPHNLLTLWSDFEFHRPLKIESVDAVVLRAPLEVPRRNAFGQMKSRPALLARMTSSDGEVGWGEAFCNWPAFAAEHRQRIITEVLAPMCAGSSFDSPVELYSVLTENSRRLRIQSGEHGPFHQSIAALDIAAWDLYARQVGQPLYKLLNDGAPSTLSVYASALAPNNLERTLQRATGLGITAFKLKVGFGLGADLAALHALQRGVPSTASVMVDANQAWTVEEALVQARALADSGAAWVEEPIVAEASPEEWLLLSQSGVAPLAAGENIASWRGFDQHLRAQTLSVYQPDLIKWGGVSVNLPLARHIRARGGRYCPHYLGGGVGLAATAHVLAAVGAPEALELDVTENPLQALTLAARNVHDGVLQLSHESGIGRIDETLVEDFRTRTETAL